MVSLEAAGLGLGVLVSLLGFATVVYCSPTVNWPELLEEPKTLGHKVAVPLWMKNSPINVFGSALVPAQS